MKHLLPLAIRHWPSTLSTPLIQLSAFFRELCSKTLKTDELEHLQKQIVDILCELERIFPPSFFVIMVHLPIHLPREAIVAGGVPYRWMYPIERYLLKLKGYVRNKGHPEGSMAEGYLLEECLTFCSRYMEDIETKFTMQDRISDDCHMHSSVDSLSIFMTRGRALGKVTPKSVTTSEWEEIHFFVLNNCDEVKPFMDEYHGEAAISTMNTSSQKRKFILWFKERVIKLSKENHSSVIKHLVALAHGPNRAITVVNGYMVNGSLFRTVESESGRETQNSGVVVKGESVTESIEYYGILQEILEVQYIGGNHVTLFRCNWWDVHNHDRGIVIDRFGFTSINPAKVLTNDPYVFASQVEQIFYVDDVVRPNWKVVVKTKPRNFYDVIEKPNETDNMDDAYP